MSQAPSFTSLVHDTKGIATLEYIILLVVVAMAGIALWKSFGLRISQSLIGGV